MAMMTLETVLWILIGIAAIANVVAAIRLQPRR
jgi:uncharacterized membrane protein